MHQAAHLGEHAGDVAARRRQHLVGRRRVPASGDAGRVDARGHRGQRGAEPVVQVAAEPAPLVLHGADELLAAALQLVRQASGPRGRRRLAHDVGQQSLVGRPQARDRTGRGQHQPADALAAVGDGQGAGGVRTATVLDEEQLSAALVHLHPDVGQPEGGTERARHLEQQLLGRGGVLEPLGERRHDGVRVLSLPDHPAPHRAGEPVPHGQVGHHHDDHGDHERLPAVERGVERPRGDAEDGQVEHDRPHDERAVDEGAPQQPVHVDELGAGDADSHRSGRHADRDEQGTARDAGRQHQRGQQHQRVDHPGPQQPAHAGPLDAGGLPEPVHDDRDGRYQADGEQQVGQAQQGREHGIRKWQRHRGEVEVEGPERVGNGSGALLRDPGGHREKHEREQRGGPDRGEPHQAPPAPREPPVREEHEQQREDEEEPGAHPLVDREGYGRTGEVRLRRRGVAEPGRGQAVERPPQPEDLQQPADQVAAAVVQHQ